MVAPFVVMSALIEFFHFIFTVHILAQGSSLTKFDFSFYNFYKNVFFQIWYTVEEGARPESST